MTTAADRRAGTAPQKSKGLPSRSRFGKPNLSPLGISPTTAPCEFWNNHFWRGGALQWGLLLRWALGVIGPAALLRAKGITPASMAALKDLIASIDGFDDEVLHLPIAGLPAALPDDPSFLPFFVDVLSHPTCDAWAQSKLVKAGDQLASFGFFHFYKTKE